MAEAPWLAPCQAWFHDAERSEPDVPDAMQVATVDAEGRPRVRTVLLKAFDARGFVFYTNRHSRKGEDLASHPHAALVLHWKSLQRQVLAEGAIETVSDAESDAYFASRPRGSQLGAWASAQSQVITGRAELEQAVAEVTARYEGVPVPRPPHWGGYRLLPTRVELWQGRADRLHERRSWRRDDEGWTLELLSP